MGEQITSLKSGLAISYACIAESIDIVELLLESGAYLFDEYEIDSKTGFAIKTLSTNNSYYDSKPNIYKSCAPLFSVARLGTQSMIDYLIKKGANPHQVDTNERTLLHHACDQNNTKILQHLIHLGIDINKREGRKGKINIIGETALDIAIKRDNIEAVKILLEHGADPNMVTYFNDMQNNWSESPIKLNTENSNCIEIQKLLVSFGK